MSAIIPIYVHKQKYNGEMLAFSFHGLDVQFTAWANGLRWPLEPLLRLVLAAVLGGLVGLEREVRGRQAGFRTNLLVSLGCALVMIVSISFAYQPWPKSMGFTINVDPARVAYGVMAGIGFLGAGVIVKHEGSVRGLTTAAGLWCVAGIGLACGLGLYLIALFAAMLVLGAMWFLGRLERLLPKVHYRTITLRRSWREGVVKQTVEMIEARGVRHVRDSCFHRVGDLSVVEIRLEVEFRRRAEYFAFEAEMERLGDCQIVSASSET